MAKALRKTLGDPGSSSSLALRGLIGRQPKALVRRWCLQYARAHFLTLFEGLCPEEPRPRLAIEAAERYAAGQGSFQEARERILACHAAARELEGRPAAQAAARACGHAASVVHVPLHAMGLYHYGAAALAYDVLGVEAGDEAYAEVATALLEDLRGSLEKAVEAAEGVG